ncbi:response regulator [Persicitalea sp.]|uniref:response regulator n=1 Tax=Persicitalea sp. TaxID=3100273 RepID=UPI003594571A
MRHDTIVLIEDDSDDKEILTMVLKDLGIDNPVVWYPTCAKAFEYLKSTSEKPFLILSDVNLPGINGIEFKHQIDQSEYLKKKCIPYVFYSTSIDQDSVDEAYNKLTVQGYFKKCSGYDEIKQTIKVIYDYWSICEHPSANQVC